MIIANSQQIYRADTIGIPTALIDLNGTFFELAFEVTIHHWRSEPVFDRKDWVYLQVSDAQSTLVKIYKLANKRL